MGDSGYYSPDGPKMMKIISRETDRFLPEDVCVGCNLCELACSLSHNDSVNPRRSRIQIHRATTAPRGDYRDYPVVCRHCPEAYCVQACPANCFTVNAKTGTYDVIPGECVGCTLCVDACPYKEIYIDPQTNLAIKCNLCDGDGPRCVDICPSHVLQLVEVEVPEGFRPLPPKGGLAY